MDRHDEQPDGGSQDTVETSDSLREAVGMADRAGRRGDTPHPGRRPLRRSGTVFDATEAAARFSPGDMPVSCHSLSQGLW